MKRSIFLLLLLLVTLSRPVVAEDRNPVTSLLRGGFRETEAMFKYRTDDRKSLSQVLKEAFDYFFGAHP